MTRKKTTSKKQTPRRAYLVTAPRTKIVVVDEKATNGREARSNYLTLFRGILNNTKLKRDDLSSTRFFLTEAPKTGRLPLTNPH